MVTPPASPRISHGRRPDDGKLAAKISLVGIVVLGDREVELAILEHLGPDPAVDAASQVLDELAVDERRDRLARLVRMDRCLEREFLQVQFFQCNLVVPRTPG